jgi:hypothetical protein
MLPKSQELVSWSYQIWALPCLWRFELHEQLNWPLLDPYAILSRFKNKNKTTHLEPETLTDTSADQ